MYVKHCRLEGDRGKFGGGFGRSATSECQGRLSPQSARLEGSCPESWSSPRLSRFAAARLGFKALTSAKWGVVAAEKGSDRPASTRSSRRAVSRPEALKLLVGPVCRSLVGDGIPAARRLMSGRLARVDVAAARDDHAREGSK